MNDNSNLNVKSDSRVKQHTLKHQALAGTEINFHELYVDQNDKCLVTQTMKFTEKSLCIEKWKQFLMVIGTGVKTNSDCNHTNDLHKTESDLFNR